MHRASWPEREKVEVKVLFSDEYKALMTQLESFRNALKTIRDNQHVSPRAVATVTLRDEFQTIRSAVYSALDELLLNEDVDTLFKSVDELTAQVAMHSSCLRIYTEQQIQPHVEYWMVNLSLYNYKGDNVHA